MFTKTVIVIMLGIYVQAYTVEYETTTNTSPDPCVKKLVTKPNHMEECTKESRVNRKYINKLKLHNWNIPKITTSLRYWAFCYLRRLDMMTDAGVLRQDVVLRNITEKERGPVIKIIDKCLYNDAHLPIDTAWHYLYCFHRMNSKLSKRIHGI